MATAIMKQKEVPEMDDVEEIISKISEDSPYKRRPTQKRTWMTVPEMGKLLGLKKTDRYWLVHKNVFESKEIAGKIRINIGLPLGDGAIRGPLKKLIEDYNLPPVVFHSFRHSSVTYKLKLNGGDIKAVQGDSGHAQVNMVTDVYSHILDDDRRKNAELFEEAFYEKKNLDPQMHVQQENNNATVADEVDPELLAKVLANPEMRALLNSLAKTMK